MSWQGKIIRIDLGKGTVKSEPLNMAWARTYIGQRGLGTKYLMSEIDPACDPLSPANKLIFATGPLTATGASTGGRYSVITKGPLTNAIACSNSGGQFGAYLKLAGWDMLILEGKSPKPVYIVVENEDVRILPADGFIWGKTVWETEDMIRAKHQNPELRVAAIGVAGETMARFACIVNDRDRAAGRSGVGAVMGSKNVKAIATFGNIGTKVADGKAFLKATRAAMDKLNPHAARERLSKRGTHSMLDVTHAYGSLPTNNCRAVQFDGAGKVNVAAAQKPRRSDGRASSQTNKACFACSIGCGRIATIDPEHFSIKDKPQYKTSLGGLEYESIYALAPMCGVDDLDAATYASALCNEHGMDPISFGASVAAAMELFDVGAITLKETGGIELKFGSAEALCWAAEATGTAQGFGKEIGLGAKRLTEKYGHPEFAMCVKGQEFPGYDVRAMQGMGLGYATSNRGACHLRASPFVDDFAHIRTEGKAEIVKKSQDRIAAWDSTGVCLFSGNAWDVSDLVAQLDASIGGGWTAEQFLETGEKIWNMERLFNMKAGFTAADDTLPKRMLETPAPSGAGKGKVNELKVMLPEYYELRGWTKDGEPTTQTLSRLGLA
ncbi:MAG: aldehyde ferredoxin oxidoreductase family protein [Proteobacteria bacterium]|nr:aldehyde ferredoxin oxidoreductase family protein [Pseudomonadota bacterium]